MAHPVNFDELKALISITDCAQWLGIKLKQNGQTFRGDCVMCGAERSFTLTPAKGLFGCFKCQKRGSILDLTHFVRETANVRDAALLLQQHFLGDRDSSSSAGTVSAPAEHSSPTITQTRREDGDELKPLDYLTTDHEAIEALGLSVAACQALGIGFAPKGTMRGRVVFPLRLGEGKLVGYIGLATNAEMSPLLLVPKNLDAMISAPVRDEKPEQGVSDVRSFLRIVK